MAAMAERLVLAFLLAAAAVLTASAVDTKLTLQNLCPFTVYPLVTSNDGFPSIAGNTVQLDANGLVSFPFPPTFWAGRVVARTLCTSPTSCETGTAPPMTVVQLVVHSTEAGPGEDLAAYSVSLKDGFNVGAVRVIGKGGGVVACKGDYGYFKQRCPLTRVSGSDVEPVPQKCLTPREL
ncbi:hypothetical protein ACQ4PT_005500 [Festuca glaucescens]